MSQEELGSSHFQTEITEEPRGRQVEEHRGRQHGEHIGRQHGEPRTGREEEQPYSREVTVRQEQAEDQYQVR